MYLVDFYIAPEFYFFNFQVVVNFFDLMDTVGCLPGKTSRPIYSHSSVCWLAWVQRIRIHWSPWTHPMKNPHCRQSPAFL